MKTQAIILSAIAHVVVAVVLLQAAERKKAHRAIAVAITGKDKPKPPPPKPPPPEPPKAKARPAAPPKAEAAPPPVAEAPPPVAAPKVPLDLGGLKSAGMDSGPGGIVDPRLVVARREPLVPPPREKKLAAAERVQVKRSIVDELAASGGGGECLEEASKPIPIFKAEIGYTAQARAEGVEGKLVLRLIVGEDGTVTRVDVVKSVEASLDAAAVAKAKEWRFKPAMRCGKPVEGVYNFGTTFELGD